MKWSGAGLAALRIRFVPHYERIAAWNVKVHKKILKGE
jgi:hypothetical protein